MVSGTYKFSGKGFRTTRGDNQRYAWKERAYVVPTSSRKKFQWKVSALRGLQRLQRADAAQPTTIVVPALYNFMPAEALSLGWLNEIDILGTIRHRIAEATRVTGWDAFTFHTLHNLDSYYASTIEAVRDTWLKEGSLKRSAIEETVRRFGAPYQYNCIPARLVENLVFQSSLMDWLTARADNAPLRYHVLGTGLLSALVWSGALPFASAVETAIKVGSRWDDGVTNLGLEELTKAGKPETKENLGWLRFNRIRMMVEGRSVISFIPSPADLPRVDAPSRPFWFSPTAADEPVKLETSRDVRAALESMNLASWSPRLPRPLPTASADIKGWLASPMHPIAGACRWSFYNFLLATPDSVSLFLDNIATLGSRQNTTPRTEEFKERLQLSTRRVTGPD